MLGVTYRGKLSGRTKHTKNYPPEKFGWVDYLPYPPTCTSILLSINKRVIYENTALIDMSKSIIIRGIPTDWIRKMNTEEKKNIKKRVN